MLRKDIKRLVLGWNHKTTAVWQFLCSACLARLVNHIATTGGCGVNVFLFCTPRRSEDVQFHYLICFKWVETSNWWFGWDITVFHWSCSWRAKQKNDGETETEEFSRRPQFFQRPYQPMWREMKIIRLFDSGFRFPRYQGRIKYPQSWWRIPWTCPPGWNRFATECHRALLLRCGWLDWKYGSIVCW